jgi:hypothetical protein
LTSLSKRRTLHRIPALRGIHRSTSIDPRSMGLVYAGLKVDCLEYTPNKAIPRYNQGAGAEALTSFMQALSLQPNNRTAAPYQALILGYLKKDTAARPVLQEPLISNTDTPKSAGILAQINALYRIQADRTAAGW